MPSPLLNLFKYLLIVLIWLFFLRVLRAVWVESRGERRSVVVASNTDVPPPPAPQKEKRGSYSRKASVPIKPELIVVSGVSPVPGSNFAVDGPITIGRAQSCDIPMVKDTFASSAHARVYQNSGQLYVEDLDSTNGTFVNGKKLAGSQVIVSGDRLQIGQTIFEVSL